MSNVPKSRRKESGFEAPHHLRKLRTEVTDLMLRQFGFSESKYNKMVEHYRASNRNSENLDEVVAKYERRLKRFYEEFIPDERKCITDILRDISREFAIANSIYPKGPAQMDEAKERRLHMDRAIGGCFALKQEVQYALEVLPVDLNQFERYAELIDLQISIFRGVRQSDNRFFRAEGAMPKSAKNTEKTKATPTDASTPCTNDSHIKTYQDVIADRQRQNSSRIPNTAKMNLSSFQPRAQEVGVIHPVLPGQKPPGT